VREDKDIIPDPKLLGSPDIEKLTASQH
jgi:hypothetical protein